MGDVLCGGGDEEWTSRFPLRTEIVTLFFLPARRIATTTPSAAGLHRNQPTRPLAYGASLARSSPRRRGLGLVADGCWRHFDHFVRERREGPASRQSACVHCTVCWEENARRKRNQVAFGGTRLVSDTMTLALRSQRKSSPFCEQNCLGSPSISGLASPHAWDDGL